MASILIQVRSNKEHQSGIPVQCESLNSTTNIRLC